MDDADKAVELDAAYAKGWYRKGQVRRPEAPAHLPCLPAHVPACYCSHHVAPETMRAL